MKCIMAKRSTFCKAKFKCKNESEALFYCHFIYQYIANATLKAIPLSNEDVLNINNIARYLGIPFEMLEKNNPDINLRKIKNLKDFFKKEIIKDNIFEFFLIDKNGFTVYFDKENYLYINYYRGLGYNDFLLTLIKFLDKDLTTIDFQMSVLDSTFTYYEYNLNENHEIESARYKFNYGKASNKEATIPESVEILKNIFEENQNNEFEIIFNPKKCSSYLNIEAKKEFKKLFNECRNNTSILNEELLGKIMKKIRIFIYPYYQNGYVFTLKFTNKETKEIYLYEIESHEKPNQSPFFKEKVIISKEVLIEDYNKKRILNFNENWWRNSEDKNKSVLNYWYSLKNKTLYESMFDVANIEIELNYPTQEEKNIKFTLPLNHGFISFFNNFIFFDVKISNAKIKRIDEKSNTFIIDKNNVSDDSICNFCINRIRKSTVGCHSCKDAHFSINNLQTIK